MTVRVGVARIAVRKAGCGIIVELPVKWLRALPLFYGRNCGLSGCFLAGQGSPFEKNVVVVIAVPKADAFVLWPCRDRFGRGSTTSARQ
jgi:hypothetical protein